MRSYYLHFKKTAAEKSEQLVNTDYYGEKRVFIPMGIKKREKKKTDMRSYYLHFKNKTAEKK